MDSENCSRVTDGHPPGDWSLASGLPESAKKKTLTLGAGYDHLAPGLKVFIKDEAKIASRVGGAEWVVELCMTKQIWHTTKCHQRQETQEEKSMYTRQQHSKYVSFKNIILSHHLPKTALLSKDKVTQYSNFCWYARSIVNISESQTYEHRIYNADQLLKVWQTFFAKTY